MDKLVFNKGMEKYCINCVNGKLLEYSGEVFCAKRGFVDKFSKCGKYKYDPLKRTPHTQDLTKVYKKEDFAL